jgi:iron complex transport system permease protein
MIRQVNLLNRGRLLTVILLLLVVLIICMILGIAFGAGNVSLKNLLPGSETTAIEHAILFNIRLPRVFIAGILGGALAVSGVVFQALLRNPLADPYVLGVSGGASIGGILAILFGLAATGSWFSSISIPVCAFAGALSALILIESIATVDGRLTVYTVLLTGVIFNAFAAAVIYFIESIASLEQLHEIVFYLMGRVPTLGHKELTLLAITVIIGTIALVTMGRDYNILSLGEESAMHLGVEVERIKQRTFILGSLLTGLSVAFAGMIGFVGLVVPHILRLILGPDHRILLPAAFLGGGGFLVLADLFARTIIAPNELPVGVVTALIGGPFFLYLLRTRSRNYGSL